jgi:hypothetical protein
VLSLLKKTELDRLFEEYALTDTLSPPILVVSGVKGAQIAEYYRITSYHLSALILVSPTTPLKDWGISISYEPDFPNAMLLRPNEVTRKEKHPLMEELRAKDSLLIYDGNLHGSQGYKLVRQWLDEQGL